MNIDQLPPMESPQQFSPVPLNFQSHNPDAPSQDFYLERLDGKKVLDELELQLRGKVPDGKGGYEQKWTAECNEEAIGKILSAVYVFGLNKNVYLGNISNDDIKNRCRAIWKACAKMFAFDCAKYGVLKENRGLLVRKIVYQVHSGLSRSEDGKEATEISTATIRQELVRSEPNRQEEKKSLINPLTWFRR